MTSSPAVIERLTQERAEAERRSERFEELLNSLDNKAILALKGEKP